VIDAAKAAADRLDLPVAVLPTVIASDAACSAVAVLYGNDGRFREYVELARSPDLVVADTALLRQSPGRLFAAGAVGALSVAYESAERLRAGKLDGPRVAFRGYEESARRTRETLLGVDPELLREPSRLEPSELEDTVYLALYQSAELFENVGLSLAHGVYRACRALGLSGRDGLLHGELVGLGLVAQLTGVASLAADAGRVEAWVGRALAGADWARVGDVLAERRAEFLAELASSPLALADGVEVDPVSVLESVRGIARRLP
jgi:glycerol dehydrogenase